MCFIFQVLTVAISNSGGISALCALKGSEFNRRLKTAFIHFISYHCSYLKVINLIFFNVTSYK
ncbi:hypothetical protein AB4K20DRAFT_1906353 [Rhizopus microsporus]